MAEQEVTPAAMIVARAWKGRLGEVVAEFKVGQVITDEWLQQQCLAEGVTLLAPDQLAGFACCPKCGSVFEHEARPRRGTN